MVTPETDPELTLIVHLSPTATSTPGDTLYLYTDASAIHVFPVKG